MDETLKAFVSGPPKPKLRVLEHPSVTKGHCMLIAADGSLLYVGPLKGAHGLLRDGASWFLGSDDFTQLALYYENFQTAATTNQVPETLQ